MQILKGTLMPYNVEIKAIVRDVVILEDIIRNMTKTAPIILCQEDIFFCVSHGRLKLRILSPDKGELIYYSRPNIIGPKLSAYRKSETDDPQGLKETLIDALGTKGIVRKTRNLYLIENTRIHIDDVEGLGRFIELEVMLKENQTTEEGIVIAEKIMSQLCIEKRDLIDAAYIDLLSALSKS
jgi:predicted adenylyl cyclase CyaB